MKTRLKAGILLERRFLKGRDRLRVAFAWLVILAPAPLIMNEGLLRTLHLWPEQVSVGRTMIWHSFRLVLVFQWQECEERL